MTSLPKRYFTPKEYLTLESEAEYKSQYVAGEIFAMAGAQPAHIDIVDNLTTALRTRFRGRPCKSYSSEMRVQVEKGEMWTYPDIVALCGTPKFETSVNPPCLLNPQVVIEVLSRSTEAFDRGDKYIRYQQLESLTDYVLVSSEKMRVEHFSRREDGTWGMAEYRQPEQRLALANVEVELPLAEIYERVEFPDSRAGT